MPTYEYECLNPEHHRFERFQSFSEPPVQQCPACGAAVRRLIFPAGVIFKGPGFYKTDYSEKTPEALEEDSSRTPEEKEAATEAKAKKDSKPATEEKPQPATKPAKKPKPAATAAE